MDLNPKLELRCPNCGVKIEQSVQRKMNKFWTGLSPTRCENCDVEIQWHQSLHKKFKIGGAFFKVGILLVLVSVLSLFWLSEFSSVMLSFSFLFILTGIFITATASNKIKVELVDKS